MTSYLDIHYEHELHNAKLLYLFAHVNDIVIVVYIIIDIMPL